MQRELNPLERVVRHEVGRRLLELRGGDVEAMADAIATKCVDGRVIALRSRGRTAVVLNRFSGTEALRYSLTEYDVLREGRLTRNERLWNGPDPSEWIEDHRDELDWLRHDLRDWMENE